MNARSSLVVAVAASVLVLAGCAPSPPPANSTDTSASTLDPTACTGCNLVLISIDTLRADRLGTYGGPAQTAPALDAFATTATVFDRAYATANRTADSHMSIMTGLYPSVHHIRNADRLPGAPRLAPTIETLAQALNAHGFATAGFHGGGNVAAVYGFDRGFDRYETTTRFEVPQATKMAQAAGWMRQHRDQPFFAFVHTYFVHDPYVPSAPYRDLFVTPDMAALPTIEALAMAPGEGYATISERFWAPIDPENSRHVTTLRALYDAAIRELDDHVGRLLSAIEDLDRPTVVVVLSDHGEEFMEHGMLTHHQLYDELLHVPLLVRLPHAPGGQRVAMPVSLVDIAPTLLDILGAPPLATAQGTSLRPLLTGAPPNDFTPSPVLSEKIWRVEPLGAQHSLRFSDHRKIIANLRQPTDQPRQHQLFDLETDPAERDNLAQRDPDYDRLRRQLRALVAANAAHRRSLTGGDTGADDDGAPQHQALDEETRKQLRALGYGG